MLFRSRIAQKNTRIKRSNRRGSIHQSSIARLSLSAEQSKHVQDIHEQSITKLAKERPDLLFSKEPIACFTLQPISYEQMMQQGGFIAKDSLWIASRITGDSQDACQSKGTICVSLQPEVSLNFLRERDVERTPYFLYALYSHFERIVAGGKWLQEIYPGSMPLSSVVRCRPVLKVADETVYLGDTKGHGDDSVLRQLNESYPLFLQNAIALPKEIGYASDDYPPVFDIKATKQSEEHRQRVIEHHQQFLALKNNNY